MRDRLLNWIARCVWRAPFLILAVAVVVAIASAWYAHRNLQINADTNDLISPRRPFMRQFRGFLEEFGDTEYIYAVVANNGNQQRTEACVDALTVELKRIASIPGVYSGVTPPEQLRIASRAMSEQELAGFAEPAHAFAVLRGGDPDQVIQQAIAWLDQLVSEGAKMSEEDQRRIGGAAVFVLNIIAAAKEDSPSAKEMAFLLGTERKTEYFKSSSGQLYFVTIIPEKNYSTLDGLRSRCNRSAPGLRACSTNFLMSRSV
jgi:predicted RND superfamily exporter protein